MDPIESLESYYRRLDAAPVGPVRSAIGWRVPLIALAAGWLVAAMANLIVNPPTGDNATGFTELRQWARQPVTANVSGQVGIKFLGDLAR